MTIVYVVTSGAYSEYGINAMFSTKSAAQEYIDKAKKIREKDGDDYNVGNVCWAGDASIEEWPLDGESAAKITRSWSVGMLLDDGSVKEGPYERQTFESPKKSFVDQFDVPVPAYNDRPIVRVVSYKSPDHALKLAAEKRQEWLRARTTTATAKTSPLP
jgi:hypothetical protein